MLKYFRNGIKIILTVFQTYYNIQLQLTFINMIMIGLKLVHSIKKKYSIFCRYSPIPKLNNERYIHELYDKFFNVKLNDYPTLSAVVKR